MNLKVGILLIAALLLCPFLFAQYPGWQQKVDYKINVEVDHETHKLKGVQQVVYTNNSNETLDKIYFHLYFNAFQPGSMMDIRSNTIMDPDKRVGDRISKLKPSEIGYMRVVSAMQGSKECGIKEDGTILEVELANPIRPGESTNLLLNFNAQIPLQIRRSGRHSSEGIFYSMAQWYPKVCGFDYMGWHLTPYVGREFFGTFGSFDVSIWIDPQFVVGATGYLIEEELAKLPALLDRESALKLKKWRFVAEMVHDFVWAADPDYVHTTHMTNDSIELHCYYQENESYNSNWEALPEIMEEALNYIQQRFGPYPFRKYSFIQGGDGGMEYPMATLITGERTLTSLVGVSIHELMHHWYHMVLATNETLYPWMDEGFTSYATSEVMNYLRAKGKLPGKVLEYPHKGSFENYKYIVKAGLEEPLSTHADHYETNVAYGVGSYSKGQIFLTQLEYIIGKEAFDKAMLQYYIEWSYKHPGPWDFLRVVEKVSGMDLDWFGQYWINTTHYIDYSVDSIYASNNIDSSHINLSRHGVFPMPVDLKVSLKNGDSLYYTIPLRIMRSEKTYSNGIHYKLAPKDWLWVETDYTLTIPYNLNDIESIELNPFKLMADIFEPNDTYPRAISEIEEELD